MKSSFNFQALALLRTCPTARHVRLYFLSFGYKFCSILVVIILLASCSLYSTPNVPSPQAPRKFNTTFKFAQKNFPVNWWKVFHNPQLNQMVNLALKNNINYQIALKNIQIAQTYVNQNASSFFPTINANYGYSRNQLSGNAAAARAFNSIGANTTNPFNYHQLGGSASYELDVWHQVANSVKQAQANVKMTAADSGIIKLTLLGDVVTTYLQINALDSSLKNLQQQHQAINAIVKVTIDQYRSGLINIEPLADIKNQAETIRSTLNETKKQRQVAYNTLAYLVGEYPEKFFWQIKQPFPALNFHKMVPAGLPAKVLVARPDIQSAYYQILVYGYLEKQNLANFLPAISLTSMYGFASTQLTNFISNGSIYWNFGATVLEPLFDAGNRMSQYRRAKLQYQTAILNYKNVVLNAFKEVDNSLTIYQRDYIILTAIQQELINAQNKYDSAKAQYIAGIYDYATYLNSRLNYLQSKYNLIQQRLTVAQDVIQIYKTLGIGCT
jgi:outer membrane protein, multidrug efflux system